MTTWTQEDFALLAAVEEQDTAIFPLSDRLEEDGDADLASGLRLATCFSRPARVGKVSCSWGWRSRGDNRLPLGLLTLLAAHVESHSVGPHSVARVFRDDFGVVVVVVAPARRSWRQEQPAGFQHCCRADAYLALAHVLRPAGRPDLIVALNSDLDRNPEDWETRRRLADVYDAHGDAARARYQRRAAGWSFRPYQGGQGDWAVERDSGFGEKSLSALPGSVCARLPESRRVSATWGVWAFPSRYEAEEAARIAWELAEYPMSRQ